MLIGKIDNKTIPCKDNQRTHFFSPADTRGHLWTNPNTVQTICYFMVLADTSTRWSHVYLFSTRNATFAKLLIQIIKLRAHHPDYPIKSIRLDNGGKFRKHSMIIACLLGLKLDIMSRMFTPKMVLQECS